MILSQKLISELKRNNRLKALIAIANECTVYTIDRWIRTGNVKLLMAAVTLHVELIKKETGFSIADIYVESETEDVSTQKKSNKRKY